MSNPVAVYMADNASALSKFLQSFEQKVDPTEICYICCEDKNEQMTTEAGNNCSHKDCKVNKFKEKLLHRKIMFERASESFSRNRSSGDTYNEAEEESSDSEAISCGCGGESFSFNRSFGDTHNEAEEESSDSEAGSCSSGGERLYPSVFYKYIKSLKSQSNPGEKCSLCNQDEDDRTISLFCGHHFHKMCMFAHMEREGYGCPKCDKLLLDPMTDYIYFKMLFGIDSDEEDHEDPDEDLYDVEHYDGC